MSGPYGSFDILVSVADLAELQANCPKVDGAPTYVLALQQVWIWLTTLPTGMATSADGSSGAVVCTPGGFWVQSGSLGSAPILRFNTITAGAAGSGRLVDIPTATFLALPNGTLAYVKSVQAYFYRLTSPTSVSSDSITILKPLGGASREVWVRIEVPTYYWQGRSTWFIDPVAGADENLGTTAGAPLAHYAELVRRIGLLFSPQNTTTVTFLADTDEYINVSVDMQAPNVQFILQGTLVQQAGPFAVTAVQAINRAANGEQRVTSTWAAAQLGQLAVLATGANAGATAWAMTDNGGGSLSTTMFVNLTSAGSNALPANANPSIGDTFNTFVPTKIGGMSVDIRGVRNPGTLAGVVVQDMLWDNTVSGVQYALTLMSASNAAYQRLKFAGTVVPRFDGGFHVINGCLFTVGGTAFGNSAPGAGQIVACGSQVSLGLSRQSVVFVLGDTFCKGTATPFTVTRGSILLLGDVGCIVTGAAIDFCALSTSGRVQFTGALYGSTGRRVATCNGGCDQLYTAAATWPIVTPAAEDFALEANTSGYAWDDTAGVAAYINAAKRTYTYALLLAATGVGGFGGSIFDPLSTCRVSQDI